MRIRTIPGMAAAKLKLEINQGATFLKTLTWSAGTPAAAVDLTGNTAGMQIRLSADSAIPIVTLTTENGGIELGGAAGTIVLTISATATAAFTFDTAVYDLEIVNAGTVTRLLQGNVILSKEVTRD